MIRPSSVSASAVSATARATRWLEDCLQDGRYSMRMIRKNPGFAAGAVLILALGIGANTAVFSVVHTVILKPLPFRDPAKLLAVWDSYLPQYSKVGISPAELQAWQTQRDVFQDTAWYGYVPRDGNLAAPGLDPIAVHADFISSNLFPLLGTRPSIGRDFTPSEDPNSALLSDRLWRSRFNGDPGVVGKVVRFNGGQLTVVGVMPPAAQFPDWADLWLPKGPLLGDQLTNPVRHALGFVARLQPGTGEKRAAARLLAISQTLAREHPTTSAGWAIRVSSLKDDLTEDVRPALLLLMGAASLLLLIACANTASLFLSRALERRKEIAVRAALGAGALRIARQLVTESLTLALLSGAGGWLLAKAALMAALPTRSHLDWVVILFLAAISSATGVLFGLAPAVQILHAGPQSALRSINAAGNGARARSALMVFEIAITLMLAIGAGILAKSFVRLMNVNPGFTSNGVLTVSMLAPPSRKPEQLFHRMREKLLSLPGVQTVAVTNALPLIADRANASRFNVPGSPLINPDALPAAQIRVVSPDYFRAMNIAVWSGRVFTEYDLNQPDVIINQTMAKRFWPGRNPVGIKFITGPWGPKPTWSTIIGVVADVKQFGLDSEPSLDIYYPSLAAQHWIIKTKSSPLALTGTVERTLRAVDPELAISEMRPMDQIVRESARTRRWTMALLSAFAVLAFALALAGIYGVIAWTVGRRTREIGIRMALGAQKRQILALVLREGIGLVFLGLLLGIVGSFALRRVLGSLVYGVSTGDPLIYASVPACIFVSALLAGYFPARKASGVDPSIALRSE